MKKLTIIVLILFSMTWLTACGSGSIDGVYRLTGGVINGYSAKEINDRGAAYLYFNADKTYKMIEIKDGRYNDFDGTWDEDYFYYWRINLVYKYEDGILSMSSVPADSNKYSPVFTKITSSSELKDVEAEINEAASESK